MATILDIKNELFTFFAKNEKFILPDQLEEILPGSNEKVSDTEIVKAALEYFVTSGIVKKFVFTELVGKGAKAKNVEKSGYILEKKLTEYDQTITISGQLAAFIAATNNSFKEKDEILCNPLAIVPADIENLIILVGQLFKKSADSQKIVNQLDLGASGLN